MSETDSSGSVPSSPSPLSTHVPGLLEPSNGMLRLGGALGVSASCLGLLIFFVACAGFDAAFHGFPIIVVILGILGLVLSVVGMLQPHHAPVEDSRVVAAFFVNAIAIIGALVEIAIWQKWVIFAPNG